MTEILGLCDSVRDDVLPNLGVRLEDHEGQSASIKLVSKETLLKERQEKLQVRLRGKKEKEVSGSFGLVIKQSGNTEKRGTRRLVACKMGIGFGNIGHYYRRPGQALQIGG